ncbi:hypothetical protein HS088_TW20G00618 [Tripterygium wilfordii]|uniref:Uncharacterized protein n=1 Tax=Tripterygium wilfordii TaxID=458696 RepID=A0A7J7C8I7_TRIWF|nr:hypothetical protein HS088_TW20G00618 [Tripterygium wilfordii]
MTWFAKPKLDFKGFFPAKMFELTVKKIHDQGGDEGPCSSYTPIDGSLCLDHNNPENGATITKENNDQMLLEGKNVNGHGSFAMVSLYRFSLAYSIAPISRKESKATRLRSVDGV